MPQATCTPGQGGTTAIAPATVALSPTEGSFPENDDETGEVILISNADPERRGAMGIQAWDSAAIVASLPPGLPRNPQANEDFKVEVTNGGTTYEASPVSVKGPPGSGYPPTHTP